MQWKDLPECDSTWESWELLSAQFPDLNLEAKVLAHGEGDDRNRKLLVYSRRSKH